MREGRGGGGGKASCPVSINGDERRSTKEFRLVSTKFQASGGEGEEEKREGAEKTWNNGRQRGGTSH